MCICLLHTYDGNRNEWDDRLVDAGKDVPLPTAYLESTGEIHLNIQENTITLDQHRNEMCWFD